MNLIMREKNFQKRMKNKKQNINQTVCEEPFEFEKPYGATVLQFFGALRENCHLFDIIDEKKKSFFCDANRTTSLLNFTFFF